MGYFSYQGTYVVGYLVRDTYFCHMCKDSITSLGFSRFLSLTQSSFMLPDLIPLKQFPVITRALDLYME